LGPFTTEPGAYIDRPANKSLVTGVLRKSGIYTPYGAFR
jgi:hypothetical protein